MRRGWGVSGKEGTGGPNARVYVVGPAQGWGGEEATQLAGGRGKRVRALVARANPNPSANNSGAGNWRCVGLLLVAGAGVGLRQGWQGVACGCTGTRTRGFRVLARNTQSPRTSTPHPHPQVDYALNTSTAALSTGRQTVGDSVEGLRQIHSTNSAALKAAFQSYITRLQRGSDWATQHLNPVRASRWVV